MGKALLDTNILVDVMQEDRPHHGESSAVVTMALEGKVEAVVTAGSLKDLYYIFAKFAGEPQARRAVRWFIGNLKVESLGYADCNDAAYSNEPDFEDGLVRAVAERIRADYIVTHDEAAFAASPVKAVSAGEMLTILQGRTSV